MRPELNDENSMARQEYELWNASRQFMKDEIGLDEFERIRQRYSGDFTDIVLGLARYKQKRRLTNSFGAITIVAILLFGVAAALSTAFYVFDVHNPIITTVFSLPILFVPLLFTPIKHKLAEVRQYYEIRSISIRHLNKTRK